MNEVALKDNIDRNWTGWENGKFAINASFQDPKNHVFVLSDNFCAQHDDSRIFGPIANKSIHN